jgi:crotonobetainyl-CoA:carnitine CoA-transferase CaiB-like acyl-CoA transferase
MKMPLEDITVIDLSHALAGPHCSMMLADFGARMIKLETFSPGALQKLGLNYEQARQRNRGIIDCSLSGFGQNGPYRDRAALDLILQAENGISV